MKVIQTPVRFYPYIGGVEQYVYYISRELIKKEDCQVKVICANEPTNNNLEETYKGINIKRLNYTTKLANTNITPKLHSTLKDENFDVIHTHIPTPWSADISNIIARRENKPLIVTYHNDIIGNGAANIIASVYNKTALKYLLNYADRIIITQPDYINSPHLQNYKDKIITIPNGVDSNLFKPSKTRVKNQIFFLSVLDRFHKYKGLDYLLKSLTDVKKHIPDVKLIIGGKGELLQEYKQKCKDLQIEDNVEFKGFLTDEEVQYYHSTSELFILPSISSLQEGFGIVVLEAMSCETPVISTTIVGVSDDITENECGIIIPPKDVKSLSKAIVKVLSDPELQVKMGKNGRRVVQQKYEWSQIADDIYKLYEQVINERGGL